MASQTFVDGNVFTAAQANTLADTVDGYATTATAAGTTTLTVASKYQQFFTGSTTQTVTMPVASTLVVGWKIRVVNNSSGIVTVQSSGANTIYAVPAGGDVIVTCILASGTTAASWDYKNYIATASTGYVGCSVSAAGSQSINNNTETIILWDTEQWDTDSIHSTSVNTGRFTVPTGKTGKWRFSGFINVDSTATAWGIYVYVDGTALVGTAVTVPGTGQGTNVAGISLELNLTAASYVELRTTQNSGGALNVRGQYSRISFQYLGA